MKTASAELKAYLASNRQFTIADLYTVSILRTSWGSGLEVSYEDFRYNSRGIDITIDGKTWSGRGLDISYDKIRSSIGLEVATAELEIIPIGGAKIAGVGLMSAIRRGLFDGGRILIEKAFIDIEAMAVIGKIYMFSGRIADAEATHEGATVTVKSDIELLNSTMPKDLYQPACLNNVYDAQCGAKAADFAKSGAIVSTSGVSIIVSGPAATQPVGYFNLGGIIITSGAQAGQARYIRSYAAGQITLAFPFHDAPAPGDEVILYPGCDGTEATCFNRFNNKANFRAMPYIPVPEVAV